MNARSAGVALSLSVGVALGLSGCSGSAHATAPQGNATALAAPVPSATPTPDPRADVLAYGTRQGWDQPGEVIDANPSGTYGSWFLATMHNPLSTAANYRVTAEWVTSDMQTVIASQTQAFTLKAGETRDVKFTARARYDLMSGYQITTVERNPA